MPRRPCRRRAPPVVIEAQTAAGAARVGRNGETRSGASGGNAKRSAVTARATVGSVSSAGRTGRTAAAVTVEVAVTVVAEGVDVENKFGQVLERVRKLGSQVGMALPSVKHAPRDSEPAT